jgi:hypothetical protein
MDRRSRLGVVDIGRQRDADGLEDTADGARHRCAQDEVLAVLLGFDLLQAVEFAQQRAPLRLQVGGGEAVFQRLAQDERQERAEHVAANGFIGLVIDRPGVENRFCRPEDVLHLEQLAIAQHDGERIEAHVGAQDIEAVMARVLGHSLVVDLEVLVVRGLEVAPIGAVGEERLVAAAQAFAQAAQLRLAHRAWLR